MKEIICNKCKSEMEFLGNISGTIYTSYPPQWDDVYVCRECETKRTIREHGESPSDYLFVQDYKEQ